MYKKETIEYHSPRAWLCIISFLKLNKLVNSKDEALQLQGKATPSHISREERMS